MMRVNGLGGKGEEGKRRKGQKQLMCAPRTRRDLRTIFWENNQIVTVANGKVLLIGGAGFPACAQEAGYSGAAWKGCATS
jgi:hypothetical protein